MDDKLIRNAKDWLIDCYPYQECEIEEADDLDIIYAIKKTYDGGLKQFILDSEPVYIGWDKIEA